VVVRAGAPIQGGEENSALKGSAHSEPSAPSLKGPFPPLLGASLTHPFSGVGRLLCRWTAHLLFYVQKEPEGGSMGQNLELINSARGAGKE
jgi:hypothetical protein